MTKLRTKRITPNILTHSGRLWNYAEPKTEDFDIEDAAHALAQEPRFAGQCKECYSVAEHCILVASLLPSAFKLQGLVHDLHEAYYKDLPTPFKILLPDYQAAENKGARIIRLAVGVPVTMDPQVKEADDLALMLERRALLPDHPTYFVLPKDLPDVPIRIRTWRHARDAYLAEYYELRAALDPARA